MILYNILLYHHIHHSTYQIILTELKTLNQYFAIETDFIEARVY